MLRSQELRSQEQGPEPSPQPAQGGALQEVLPGGHSSAGALLEGEVSARGCGQDEWAKVGRGSEGGREHRVQCGLKS